MKVKDLEGIAVDRIDVYYMNDAGAFIYLVRGLYLNQFPQSMLEMRVATISASKLNLLEICVIE